MARLLPPKVYTLLCVTIGSILFAVGMNAFLLPHKLVAGGLSGITMIIYYVSGFATGTSNFILNLPIMYAAYRWLGGWHLLVTIFGTVVISLAMNVLTFMIPMQLTQSAIAGAIFGGICCGLGLGISYRAGGNTGGLDPVALIIRKYWGLQVGSINLCINFIVLFVACFILGFEAVGLTLINIFISSTVTNKVVVGFNQRKAAYIISYKPDKICEEIITKLGRGATILEGQGAYTRQKKQVIMVVVNLMQVVKLKNLVTESDPEAFLIITDASEVVGQGFTFKKNRLEEKAKTE